MRSNLPLWLLAISCSSGTGTSSPPPTPPAAADLVLHTTLDGPAAVVTPSLGSGVGAAVSTSPVNDFVSARFGVGLRTDAAGEHVKFPQTDGRLQNVELERGTLEFWYRPNYNHDNNLKYTIAGTGNWLAPGAIHLGKHNSSNQNAIFLVFYDGNGVRWEHDVAVTDYSWKTGDWLLVRLTWDFGVPAGVQNLHLYLDGRELRLTGQVSRGPRLVPTERPNEMVYIGSRDDSGPIIADGVYDEVRIWNRAVPPS